MRTIGVAFAQCFADRLAGDAPTDDDYSALHAGDSARCGFPGVPRVLRPDERPAP